MPQSPLAVAMKQKSTLIRRRTRLWSRRHWNKKKKETSDRDLRASSWCAVRPAPRNHLITGRVYERKTNLSKGGWGQAMRRRNWPPGEGGMHKKHCKELHPQREGRAWHGSCSACLVLLAMRIKFRLFEELTESGLEGSSGLYWESPRGRCMAW